MKRVLEKCFAKYLVVSGLYENGFQQVTQYTVHMFAHLCITLHYCAHCAFILIYIHTYVCNMYVHLLVNVWPDFTSLMIIIFLTWFPLTIQWPSRPWEWKWVALATLWHYHVPPFVLQLGVARGAGHWPVHQVITELVELGDGWAFHFVLCVDKITFPNVTQESHLT